MEKETKSVWLFVIIAWIILSIPHIYLLYFGWIKGDYYNLIFGGSTYSNGFMGYISLLVRNFKVISVFYLLSIIFFVIAYTSYKDLNNKQEAKKLIKKTCLIVLLLFCLTIIPCRLVYNYLSITSDRAQVVNKYLKRNYKNEGFRVSKILVDKKLEYYSQFSGYDEDSIYIVFEANNSKREKIHIKYIEIDEKNFREIIDDRNPIYTSIDEEHVYSVFSDYNE